MKKGKPGPFIQYTDDGDINRLLNDIVSYVKTFTEAQMDHIRRLTQVGLALSAERDMDRLLETIVDEARAFTHADGGTLYLLSEKERALHFEIVQNDTLFLRMGGTGGEITWAPVSLSQADGSPNHTHVSAHAALSGEVISIPDVYHVEGFNFEGTREFDAKTGYRSRSMLVIPMRDHENEIIGVLQLLNSKDPETGAIRVFSQESQQMAESLASQAAVVITNHRLFKELEVLLQSFIKTFVTAVDEKSPYTGGHVRRVSELTMAIAERINACEEGPLAGVHWDKEQMKELQLAAWLHDVGKVVTPEHIMDKARKLEGVFDRVEIIRTRFALYERDCEIRMLRRLLAGKENRDHVIREFEQAVAGNQGDLALLYRVNDGTAVMGDEDRKTLRRLAERKVMVSGKEEALISPQELHNLLIPRGTLTPEERQIVENHASLSFQLLAQLPFPKKLKNLPMFAGAHHERPDGTGYPWGIKGDALPLQPRIIALADIFEALTARDRPYKKAKTPEEAVVILADLAAKGAIDPDVFDVFLKSGIHRTWGKEGIGNPGASKSGPDAPIP